MARANAVCDRVTKNAPSFPYQTFNPLHPNAQLLPKVGAFFARRQAITDAVPKQLRALGAPKTGGAVWAQLLTLATRERVIADRQIKAAQASDVPGFVATVNAVSNVSRRLHNLATEAGFSRTSSCAMVF